MTRLTAIDLSQLPPPQSVMEMSPEQEAQELLTLVQKYCPDFSGYVESDPVIKLIEAFGYRLSLVRQQANEAIKGVMLAYAQGTDLDQLGANFDVKRLVITPANQNTIPPTEEVLENDDAFRKRIQLSFERFSTAGSRGSYEFFAKSASSEVVDVQVTSPTPGDIVIYVLSREGQGEADETLLKSVSEAVNSEEVRPLTDRVSVTTTKIIPYSIAATLYVGIGPDAETVFEQASTALRSYCDSVHKIGHVVAISGIYAALQQPGVERVMLHDWQSDLAVQDGETSFCTNISINQVLQYE